MTRCAAALVCWAGASTTFAAPPMRKPLDAGQRVAVLALMKATDAAQVSGLAAGSDAGLQWESAAFKSTDGRTYVPFRVTPTSPLASATAYVRVVSHRNGVARVDELSGLRSWILAGAGARQVVHETIVLGPGEMPVGGPGAGSSRRTTQQATDAHTALELQQKAYEKDKAAAETARLVFPFEEYYFFSGPALERALALSPGEYDVYVAALDRTKKDAAPVVMKRALTVQDFANDQLVLSTLILVRDVRTLKVPLAPEQQAEHPFTFGHAELVPVTAPTFARDEPLAVVYQLNNYGAPDSSLTAEYAFYRADGARRLFNRTEPQRLTDADLPPANPWSTQAFAMQTVSLASFPPGEYELEVTVNDRLTRATATGTVAFTVAVR